MAKEGWKRKRAMRSALSYLYSYRCMGKVGNLLARPPPSLPLPIFNPLFFHRPPLATSSPAINTKNSQGRTAPPRFIAYEFSDLSIAATCLSAVTADPHLPSRASSLGFELCLSRSGATYFPGTNAMNHACLPLPPATSAPPQISEADVACRPETSRYRAFSPRGFDTFFRTCFFCSKKRLNRIYLEMDFGYSLLSGKKIHRFHEETCSLILDLDCILISIFKREKFAQNSFILERISR